MKLPHQLSAFVFAFYMSSFIALVMSAVLTVVMGAACWVVFRSGWRLKS